MHASMVNFYELNFVAKMSMVCDYISPYYYYYYYEQTHKCTSPHIFTWNRTEYLLVNINSCMNMR